MKSQTKTITRRNLFTAATLAAGAGITLILSGCATPRGGARRTSRRTSRRVTRRRY